MVMHQGCGFQVTSVRSPDMHSSVHETGVICEHFMLHFHGNNVMLERLGYSADLIHKIPLCTPVSSAQSLTMVDVVGCRVGIPRAIGGGPGRNRAVVSSASIEIRGESTGILML